ncbi:hypothetical protein SPD48_14475 [Pseudogracilibacillus sp. SE30717A]
MTRQDNEKLKEQISKTVTSFDRAIESINLFEKMLARMEVAK